MNIWNIFSTCTGAQIRFRRKHPSESFAGKPGVYAYTVIDGFDVRPLHFAAANDLSCVDEPLLQFETTYKACQKLGSVGVAVCIMRGTTEAYRLSVAGALNDALPEPSSVAA